MACEMFTSDLTSQQRANLQLNDSKNAIINCTVVLFKINLSSYLYEFSNVI